MQTPQITENEITQAELLRRIKAVILEEPRRLHMADWIFSVEGKDNEISHLMREMVPERPACGTVACLAGWGYVLLRGADVLLVEHSDSDMYHHSGGLFVKARDVNVTLTRVLEPYAWRANSLNYTWTDSASTTYQDGLFGDLSYHDIPDGEHMPTPGSQAYAEAVGRRIDRYLNAHRRALEENVIDRRTLTVRYPVTPQPQKQV